MFRQYGPPTHPGRPLFVPSLSLKPDAAPSMRNWRAEFSNVHVDFNALLRKQALYPPLNRYLLPDEDVAQEGGWGDAFNLAFRYAKPYVAEALPHSSPTGRFENMSKSIKLVGMLGLSLVPSVRTSILKPLGQVSVTLPGSFDNIRMSVGTGTGFLTARYPGEIPESDKDNWWVSFHIDLGPYLTWHPKGPKIKPPPPF